MDRLNSNNGIKAVIFDCDGVILDSRAANASFYNQFLSHFNRMPLTEEQEFTIESQAFALLRKPLDMDRLLATVRAALSSLSGPAGDEAGAQPLA